MNKNLLVIGLGNALFGDDGFGHLVLERLRQGDPEELDSYDLVEAHTDLLAWIDSFQHYKEIVLVDALLDPPNTFANSGAVLILSEDEVANLPDSTRGVHTISPLLAVKLYRRLYGEAGPKFSVIALCTDRVEVGRATYLTDAAVNEGCRLIRQLLAIEGRSNPTSAREFPSGT